MKIDVLLINGVFRKERLIDYVEPVALCCLAAFLRRKNYSIVMHDPLLSGETKEEICRLTKEKKPQMVGISIIAENIREDALFLIEKLRRTGFKGHICVGGQEPSLNWKDYLGKSSEIDSVVIGEGEETLSELVGAIRRDEEWRNINGIAYRVNGRIVKNKPRNLIENLDFLPFMARDLLLQHANLLNANPVASIITSRGCYRNCIFCSIRAYYEAQTGKLVYRQRSAKNVISEMKELHQKYGLRKFVFADDNFLPPDGSGLERVKEFHSQLERLKTEIEFGIATRIDNLSRKAIELLKEVGLRTITIGIESFLDKDLLLYNKGFSSNDVVDGLDMLEELGFSAKVDAKFRLRPSTIIFNPFTTLEALREQTKYLKKYHISPKRFLGTLIVYGHTKIEQMLKEKGLLDSRNKYQFIDKRVELVHDWCEKYLRHVLSFRDRIRTLEKICSNIPAVPDLSNLSQIRSKMDSNCYDFFDGLLGIAEQESEEDAKQYCQLQIQHFNQFFDTNNLEKEIQEIFKYPDKGTCFSG